MGKLFKHKKFFLLEDEFEDDDIDDEELDEELEESDEEDEDYESDDEELDDDESDESDDEEEDGESDESDDEKEDGESDEADDEKDSESDDDDDDESDEEDEEDEEDLEEDEEIDEEEYEIDRREYRRKRRIRNQAIAYGVVAVLLFVLIGAGVFAGKNIADSVKEKKQAEEFALQLAQQEESEPEDLVIEAPPEIEEASLDEQLDEIVNSCISEMPLEDKIAGLFIVTPESLTGVGTVTQAGEGTQNALNQYAVGGFVYFDKNIIDKEQLSTMLHNTTPKSKYPIFLAVDEEGGEVARVANSDIEVAQVGDMSEIGASGDTAKAYETGTTIGSYLSELGFNLNFAPVADVTAAGNAALGNRSFGEDTALVSDMAVNMIEGMEGTGISACMKHFPGIGSAQEDTHEGRVEITKSLDEMRSSDFLPFKAGIDAGVDMIMVGHAVASEIDTAGNPSSLSEMMVTNILRSELGYQGIIITDALNMQAITDYYTSAEAAVMAIEAGVDMLLMPENFEEAYEAVLTAVQDGTISEERINESLQRIYRVKYADKLQ